MPFNNTTSCLLRTCKLLAITVLVTTLIGCGFSYRAPGRGADLSAFGLTKDMRESLTDSSIQRALDKKPLATFPVTLAIVRVQDSGYYSYNVRSHGHGKYSVVTQRDLETDEDFAALRALPQVKSVVGINRLLLPSNLTSDKQLRAAAAAVHADMMLIYTVDTTFKTEESLEPLGFITLGLFPNQTARVNSTTSAILIDTRNGYTYAAAEASAKHNALTNAWSNKSTVDRSRRKTERESFEKLLQNFIQTWPNLVQAYSVASR